MNEATELKQRIMSRIPSIKRQTTECLRAAMSNDIFVYLPTPAASHALFKEWTRLFDQEYLGNIAVVTGDIEQLRKRESNDLGDSLRVFSRGHKRLFAFTYEEFLSLEDKIAIQDYNSPGFISSVIFEGFEDISKFEKMIDRLRGPLRKILFKIALTNLPSTFYNYYYSSKNRYFECFLPIWSQDGFSFYKKLYDGCKIVSYTSYESDVPAISLISVIQESNFENQQQILNLIKRNIFDYNHAKSILKMSTKFISNKLIGLFNILKQRSGQNNYIYFSSESDMKTVYEIVCGRCDIKDPLEQSKQESCNIYLIRNGVLKGTDIVFNAKFITDIPSISRHDENIAIIFFNFAPFIHRCPRFYLLSSREIEEFKKNIIFDEKIIKEIKPALKINIKESNKSIPVNFMVLSNDIKYCQDKLRGKYSTKSIELQGNYVNVSAYSKSYFTAIDLSNILKFPVVFPKMPYKSYIDTYICQRLIFGTLSTLNSFVDPFEIRCNGFLTFISKGFIVYAFSNRINLRVEVQQEDIETYVFMDVQKQERSTDRSYVSLLFALRRYPKIFTCDRDGLIGKYVKDTIPAGEKLMFFETLQWRRASIVEVPFVSERYDLKISLPFHQPVKGEQSYEFKPNIDRISNIAASRINDDVAQDYMFTNQNDKFSSKNIIDDSDKLCGDVGEKMYKSNCKEQYNDEYDNNDMQYKGGNEKMYSRSPRAASYTYTNDDGNEKVYSRSPQAAVDMCNNDNKHYNDGNEKVYSRSDKVKKDGFYANENISNDAVNNKDDQSTDTTDSRRKKHSFCLIEALLNSLHQIQTRVVAASVPHISSPKLPLKKVLQYFMESPFDDFYSIACLISKKGRLLVNKICPKDLEYISSLDIPSFCRAFESSLKWRFESVNIRMQFTPFERPQGTLIRSVTITPLSIVYHFEAPSESNRVLRRFDPDKFIRIAIREENDRHKFSSDSTKNEDAVYDYFRSTMINGLPIGLRRYFFLIMTTSQLKTHNAWFVTPHESNGVLIGADYIKMWLGEFQDIKNIGKYAVRVGQALSSTTPTLEFNSFLQVPDIERNNYNFTDGVGILSYSNAQKLSKSLGLLTVPSAFQIRFAGYKGVIAVHPFVDNKAKFKEWLKRNVKANSSDFVLVNDDKRVSEQPTVIKESLNYFRDGIVNDQAKDFVNDEVAGFINDNNGFILEDKNLNNDLVNENNNNGLICENVSNDLIINENEGNSPIPNDIINNTNNISNNVNAIQSNVADNLVICKMIDEIQESQTAQRRTDPEDLSIQEIGGLILRKSMNKFSSTHRVIEVISTSKSSDFYLNRQIIQVLEGLGIPSNVFVNLQDEYFLSLLTSAAMDFPSFIRKYIQHFPKNYISSQFSFFRKLLHPIFAKVLEEVKQKSRIYVPEGRSAMGVTDELDLLEENEVFLMFPKRDSSFNSKQDPILFSNNRDSSVFSNKQDCSTFSSMFCNEYGSYLVPNTTAFIVKNPCIHPGDIRIVKCVDRPELHYLKDVIVFSQKGDRPLFNQCSGSDLDGDIYLLCWNPLLIPKVSFKPYNYVSVNALHKESVLLNDMVNFFIRYMRSNELGVIAHSLMAESDKNTVFSEKALRLAELFNRSIDYVKTGSAASAPEDLIPEDYPDFMERQPSYTSQKALGLLYRRSSINLSFDCCECLICCKKDLNKPTWENFILKGSSPLIRNLDLDEVNPSEDEIYYFESYKNEIKSLIFKYGLNSEEQLFMLDEANDEVKTIINRYRNVVQNKNIGVFAYLSNNCSECINSMPWISSYAYRLKSKSFVLNESKSSNFVFNSKVCIVSVESGSKRCKKSDKNGDGDENDGGNECVRDCDVNVGSTKNVCDECEKSWDDGDENNNNTNCADNTNCGNDTNCVDDTSASQIVSANANACDDIKVNPIKTADSKTNDGKLAFLQEIDKLTSKNKKNINKTEIIYDDTEIKRSIDNFYKNSFTGDILYVKADYELYKKFVDKIDSKRIEIFRELFNLIIISGLYRIDEINKIIELFIIINDRMYDSTRMSFCRALFPIADNTLFKIGFLIALDYSIVKKAQIVAQKESCNRTEVHKAIKIHKNTDSIISGMLDENDDVEFVRSSNWYIPVLKNKGICTVDYYKDNVRDFIANILYSYENMQFIKSRCCENGDRINDRLGDNKNDSGRLCDKSDSGRLCDSGRLNDSGRGDRINDRNDSSRSEDNKLSGRGEDNKFSGRGEDNKFSGRSEDKLSSRNDSTRNENKSNINKDAGVDENTSGNRNDITGNEGRVNGKLQLKITDPSQDISQFTKNICIQNQMSLFDIKNSKTRIVYSLCLTPGSFYLSKLPKDLVNDKMSIKQLHSMLNFRSVPSETDGIVTMFVNKHRCLDPAKREEFLLSIKKIEKVGEISNLSFYFKERRYDLLYCGSVLIRISKGRKVMGKSFIINNQEINDLSLELVREEIIYDDTLNNLDDDEFFMLRPGLFSFISESDTYSLNPILGQCANYRLEISTLFRNEDGFTISYKTTMTSCSLTMHKTDGRLVCYATKEWFTDGLDYGNFNKMFSKMWKMYSTILILK